MTESIPYYNPIHSTIGATENYTPIFASTAVGGVVAGSAGFSSTHGAAIGFLLGAIDVLANSFEIYERPYLTSAVLGAGTLSKIDLPHNTAPALGFAVGLTIPTGALNDYFAIATTPISTALYGYSYGGSYGAAAGFTAGIIDECLHNYNITSQHYLSSAIKGITTAKLMSPIAAFAAKPFISETSIVMQIAHTSYAKEVAGAAYGAYRASNNEPPSKPTALKLSDDVYDTYSSLMTPKQLQETIDHQAVSVVAMSIITQNLAIGLAGHFQGIRENLENFKTSTDLAWPNFIREFKDFAAYIPPYIGGHIATEIVNQFFATKLQHVNSDIINHKLIEGETILKLAQDQGENVTDANYLIKSKQDDINTLTAASNTLSEALGTYVKGIFGINYLISIQAQDIVMYSILYNSLTDSISTLVSEQKGSYDLEISELEDRKTSLEEYLRVNADAIVQRDSNDFIKAKSDEIDDALRTANGKKLTWSTLDQIWSTFKNISNFLTDYLSVAYHLKTGTITFDTRFKVLMINQDVSPMLNWDGENAGALTSTRQAVNRLNELIQRMDEETADKKLLPEYSYSSADSTTPWICLDNLTVGAGDKTLMHTNHQCIDSNIIAVTGESHSGKSTLLKLIKGLEHSGAWGNGGITFYTDNGQMPDVVMASQHFNAPPYTTLLELITLMPKEEALKVEQQVKDLMVEIGIDSGDDGQKGLTSLLNEKKDWDQYITSGGARKKLMAIWVITQEPDIAILDELFVGIDRQAIEKIQGMFKHHLPDTKFLVVDHEAFAHNTTGFYDQELHVRQKAIHLQQFESSQIQHGNNDSAQVQDSCLDICPLHENITEIFNPWAEYESYC